MCVCVCVCVCVPHSNIRFREQHSSCVLSVCACVRTRGMPEHEDGAMCVRVCVRVNPCPTVRYDRHPCWRYTRPEDSVLLACVADTDHVTDVCQRYLECLVHEDRTGVSEPEQRVIREHALWIHGAHTPHSTHLNTCQVTYMILPGVNALI